MQVTHFFLNRTAKTHKKMFVGEGGGEFVFLGGGAGRGCLHTTATQTKKRLIFISRSSNLRSEVRSGFEPL